MSYRGNHEWNDEPLRQWVQKPLPWWVHLLIGFIVGLAVMYLAIGPGPSGA